MKSNGKLKIEKGVPIPGTGRGISSILRKLKVGESIELKNIGDVRQTALYALGAGNFTTRKTETGTRVWRIK